MIKSTADEIYLCVGGLGFAEYFSLMRASTVCHSERRFVKTQFLQTEVEESHHFVGVIEKVINLRLFAWVNGILRLHTACYAQDDKNRNCFD